MKKALRALKWTGLSLGVLLAGLALVVTGLSLRRYEAPLPALRASSDPALIERGRYLAFGPAHCATCHAPPGATGEAALSGGMVFDLPIGIFRPANLTPDVETGIGGSTDAELARALRHGVSRDGRALMPFMPFADLSDEDLVAVLSYLRSRPPVKQVVRQHQENLMGRVVEALLIRPAGPTSPPPARVAAGPTVAYGRYLANAVGNCAGCHTERNEVTGAFVGAPLAGGLHLESHTHPGIQFVTPNLTPDATTGRLAGWTEDLFIARFRLARGAEGTPMPWPQYATMTDDDLRAIFRYLGSLPPVKHDTGPSVPTPVAAR
jgi:mono/diheme cytochrome c family protein